MTTIRLIIADHFPVVREGVRSVFAEYSDINILGEAGSADEALSLARLHHPQILLTDLLLPGCAGKSLIKQVKNVSPNTAVLVFTAQKEEHHAVTTLRSGASGFISKSRPVQEVLEATRQVARGEIFISREFSRHIAMGAFGLGCARAPHEQLSQREKEVFLKLASGRTVSEIAGRLHLSPKTVSTHKKRILQKLGLNNMSTLVRYALEHELL